METTRKSATFVRVIIAVKAMKRIFLIGYMGAGKTTLGRSLAVELGLSFVDLDWYIEERHYKTIRELFDEKGEESFRLLEQQMLHEVAEIENVVISTGGGTPCFFDNLDFMNQKGSTIFLNVSRETLFRRLKVAKQSRPLLADKTDDELRTIIDEGLKSREPIYSQARYVLNTDKLESRSQIKETIQTLLELLKLRPQ